MRRDWVAEFDSLARASRGGGFQELIEIVRGLHLPTSIPRRGSAAIVALRGGRDIARRSPVAPSRLARGRARPLETAHTHRNDHDVDVVDELRLVIGPMIVGRGRRLLDGPSSIQLELVRSETSPTGYLLVDYRVIR